MSEEMLQCVEAIQPAMKKLADLLYVELLEEPPDTNVWEAAAFRYCRASDAAAFIESLREQVKSREGEE